MLPRQLWNTYDYLIPFTLVFCHKKYRVVYGLPDYEFKTNNSILKNEDWQGFQKISTTLEHYPYYNTTRYKKAYYPLGKFCNKIVINHPFTFSIKLSFMLVAWSLIQSHRAAKPPVV